MLEMWMLSINVGVGIAEPDMLIVEAMSVLLLGEAEVVIEAMFIDEEAMSMDEVVGMAIDIDIAIDVSLRAMVIDDAIEIPPLPDCIAIPPPMYAVLAP